jgi:hypothetical protein
MVMSVNEPGKSSTIEVSLEEDDHDGWGPIRPRRSSMPAPVVAASEHDTQPEAAASEVGSADDSDDESLS